MAGRVAGEPDHGHVRAAPVTPTGYARVRGWLLVLAALAAAAALIAWLVTVVMIVAAQGRSRTV